ncbi:DUF2572 family protein [Testudinibacter sp. P80/BLE/0925]|uniref:DUF2572 family protein n=1 Tax=Testudinibacter sp. TW-1 TaxID=3417757 RepID=UPI003D36D101
MLAWKKGMASLWALLLLSSVLWLFLLVDHDVLGLQRANLGERMRYLQQREPLLARSLSPDADSACRQAAINRAESDTFRLTFAGADKQTQRHFVLCRQLSLFKQLPQQALASKIGDFLNAEVEQFTFLTLPLSAEDYQRGGILWLVENAEWQLQQDFYGVVITEGDLSLNGDGTLFGAVIHNGKVRLERQDQIVFTPQVIEKTAAEYQQWQYRQGSWHDFNPL